MRLKLFGRQARTQQSCKHIGADDISVARADAARGDRERAIHSEMPYPFHIKARNFHDCHEFRLVEVRKDSVFQLVDSNARFTHFTSCVEICGIADRRLAERSATVAGMAFTG